MKAFIKGLITGIFFQLALGPIFFFIANLTIQKTLLDGLAGTLAVTTVDYFYITLSIFGIGKLLDKKNIKKAFGIISSIVLAIFGAFIIKGILEEPHTIEVIPSSTNILLSFTSVFLLTISNPLTIVFFTSLFTAKALEYNYTKKQLLFFGLGAGLATFIFMGTSVVLFSLIKGTIPTFLIQVLNILVGCILIGYGSLRLIKIVKSKTNLQLTN